MDNKTALVIFTENWTQGAARAITDQDRKMLAELRLTCVPDPFPEDVGEEIGVPRGSSFGEVAGEIVGVVGEWSGQE